MGVFNICMLFVYVKQLIVKQVHTDESSLPGTNQLELGLQSYEVADKICFRTSSFVCKSVCIHTRSAETFDILMGLIAHRSKYGHIVPNTTILVEIIRV